MTKVVLIVEGLNDEKQVRSAFEDMDEVGIIVTEGTKFNTYTIDKVNNFIDEGYTPYILSDPDTGGDHLAEMVHNHFPEIERIDVDIKECGYHTGKKMKAGIEYASHEYLKSIVYPLIGLKYKKKEYPINWD